MSRVLLDLNGSGFQADLFALERDELIGVVATLGKIRQLNWNQLYSDQVALHPDHDSAY